MEIQLGMLSTESLTLALEFAAVQWVNDTGGTKLEFTKRLPAKLRQIRVEKAAVLIVALRAAGITVEMKG